MKFSVPCNVTGYNKRIEIGPFWRYHNPYSPNLSGDMMMASTQEYFWSEVHFLGQAEERFH